MKKIDALINAWMHDEATEEQVQQLFAWVRSSPENAREFARATSLHSDLKTYFSGRRSIIEAGEQPLVVPVQTPARPSQRRLWSISASIAACIMLVTGLTLLFVHVETSTTVVDTDTASDEPSRSATPFVTVAQTEQAEWERATDLSVGDRIASEVLVLRSGTAKLLFDDGVEVTLRGPSQYDLISRGSTKLNAGLLTASVPPGAEGFRVETPSAEVFDLGTAFGVSVSESGDSHVSVFEGAVHVFPMTGGPGQMLAAGEEVAVAVGSDVSTEEFNSAPFEDLWPVSSGITSASGAVRYQSPWQKSAKESPDHSEICVQPEGYATILSQPLDVDVASAGEYSSVSQFRRTELGAGQRVKSYLVRFDPQDNPRSRGRTAGTVTFNRDVLGLILKEDSLSASQPKFAKMDGPAAIDQLDFDEDRLGDAVTFSEDRRTVSFDLINQTREPGHVRVIVDDSWSEIEETGIALSNIGASDVRLSATDRRHASQSARTDLPESHLPGGRMLHPGHMRLMRSRDFDGDGRISEDEFPRHMFPFFHRLDLDGDGFVTPDELNRSRRRGGMRPGPHPGPHLNSIPPIRRRTRT